jgi:hypothetical protein
MRCLGRVSRARSALGALACVAAMARSAQASELTLDAGTRQLGGQVTLKVAHYSQGTAETATHLMLSPGGGWFVADGLELRLGLGFDLALENGHANTGASVWGDVGVRWYYRGFAAAVPYVGAGVGPSWVFTNTDDTAMTVALSLPLGVLVAFNPHVALDLGARLELDLGVKNARGTTVQATLGYLGVLAFF